MINVNIGIETPGTPSGFGRPSLKRLEPDKNMWYPRVPDAHLDLNIESYSFCLRRLLGLSPICWAHFGGARGAYLRSLTGISVRFEREIMRCIEFHYSGMDVPLDCRKLGRCSPKHCTSTVEFAIDGRAGEIIGGVFLGNKGSYSAPMCFRVRRILSQSASMYTNEPYRSRPSGEDPFISRAPNHSSMLKT